MPRYDNKGPVFTTRLAHGENDIDIARRSFDFFSYGVKPVPGEQDSKHGRIKAKLYTFVNKAFENQAILSVRYTGDDRAYIMTRKGEYQRVSGMLDDVLDEDVYVIPPEETELTDQIYLQLMINSIAHSRSEIYAVNNLDGILTFTDDRWIVSYKLNEKKDAEFFEPDVTVRMIPVLRMRVDKDSVLVPKAVGHSDLRLRNRFRKGKNIKNPELLPRYSFIEGRIVSGERRGKPVYVRRQLRGKKASWDYFGVSGYEHCKVAVMQSVLREFSARYGGLGLSLGMTEIPDCTWVPPSRTTSYSRVQKTLEDIFAHRGIVIVDAAKDGLSEPIVRYYADLVGSWGGAVSFSDEPVKGRMNIAIIHDSDFYKRNGLEDIYQPCPEIAVQHVTVENWGKPIDMPVRSDFEDEKEFVKKMRSAERRMRSREGTARFTLANLVVKADLLDGGMSLFDWSSGPWSSEEVEFIFRPRNDVSVLVRLTVHPDGSIETSQLPIGERWRAYFPITDDEGLLGDQPRMVIIRGDDVNLLYDTSMHTYPSAADIESFRAEREGGERDKFRSGLERNAFLMSFRDVQYWNEDGVLFYSTGTPDQLDQKGLSYGPVVRRVVPEGDSKLFFVDMIGLLLPTFVRNKQLTVFPLPLKYLREAATMFGYKPVDPEAEGAED